MASGVAQNQQLQTRNKWFNDTGGVLQQRPTMALLRPEGQLVPSTLHCWCPGLVVSFISNEACCSRLEATVIRAHSKMILDCIRGICKPVAAFVA